MNLSLIQTAAVFSVLLVSLVHLYLDQFSKPKSDIQIFTNPDKLHYGPVENDKLKIHFEFTSSNRGEDNGYIDRARLIGFEFSNTDRFSEVDHYEFGELLASASPPYDYHPAIKLKKDDENTIIHVPKGETVSFKAVCELGSENLKVSDVYSEYYSMRAVIEFECRDSGRKYKRVVKTSRVDAW